MGVALPMWLATVAKPWFITYATCWGSAMNSSPSQSTMSVVDCPLFDRKGITFQKSLDLSICYKNKLPLIDVSALQ